MFVTDKILEFAKSEPDKKALVYGNDSYTYAEFADKMIAVSKALERLKVKKEAHIISVAMPSLEYVALCYGIQLYGAVHIPVEKTAGAGRIIEIANQVDADLVIGPEKMEMPYLCLSWEEFFLEEDYVKGACGDFVIPELPDDVCSEVIFTTGTTGSSKAVMHSKYSLWNLASIVSKAYGIDSSTIFLLGTPLNHAGGLRKLHLVFSQGGTMVLLDGISNLKLIFDSIASEQINVIYLPPSCVHMILRFASAQLSGLKDQIKLVITGSAPYPEVDQIKMCELLPNTKLLNAYGSSEAGTNCYYEYGKYGIRPNCIGKPFEGVQIQLKGEDKLLSVKTPMKMIGYYKNEELTKSCYDEDGWFVTSDSAYYDEDGFIRFNGRADDVINVGGLKIAPLELEEVVLKYAGISECVCISVPDKMTGCALKLLYVSENDNDIDIRGLQAFIGERLENYKVPQKYEKVDHIEKTANGKINRKAYR